MLRLKLFISIKIIMLISFSKYKVNCIKCKVDKLKINPGILDFSENVPKRRMDTESDNEEDNHIKIFINKCNFKNPATGMDQSIYNKINDLLNETITAVQQLLKIEHEDISTINAQETIKQRCNLDIVENYEKMLIENDIVIFPSFKDDLDDDVLSVGKFCLITKKSRPCGGVLYINPNINFEKENSDLYFKYVLLHEITHILLFDPKILDLLGMIKYEEEDDVLKAYIISEKVVQKAQEHFNCSSIEGVPLEDYTGEETVGYHWNSRAMLGDYMISMDYIDTVISDITLALFEDSGFYQVEYYSGGLFKFGKNKGCDFLVSNCIFNGSLLFDDFCVIPGQSICTQSRTIKGRCKIYDYKKNITNKYQYFMKSNYGGLEILNYCPISDVDDITTENNYFPTSCSKGESTFSNDYGEIIGDNSFCFNSSLKPSSYNGEINWEAICYKVECNDDNKEIKITIGEGNVVNCPEEGGEFELVGFNGKVKCPEYNNLCNIENKANICNELFECINKKVKGEEISYDYNIKFKSSFYINLIILFIYVFLR